MKKILLLLLVLLSVNDMKAGSVIKFARANNSEYVIQQQILFNPNRIMTWIQNTGIFNQDIRTNNTPGFSWPIGSNRFAIFTTGLTIGAKVNGGIRLAACSYKGEYAPGRMLNGAPDTVSNFKLYKVSRGDGPSNPDWVNWYRMIPYGAPYYDVNNNGIFEPNIDTPGVKFAAQTVFICMTDGFTETHNQSEGFSGGTLPLFAEMHLSAWGYSNTEYSDMQFIKFEIINKGANIWDSTYMSVICDPDLGSGEDDYIGCDTVRQLGYVYNADNFDGSGSPPSYGSNPPAAGLMYLKGGRILGINPKDLYLTSFINFTGSGSGDITCEQDPSQQSEAYNYLKGQKKDGSYWRDPLTKQRVFIEYPGDPENGTGWTEFGYNGIATLAHIKNCAGGDTITSYQSPPGDRRFCMGTGAPNFVVSPGDTQKIILCQLIARGANNLNSVTKLKQLADVARSLYNNNFVIGVKNISSEAPTSFILYQNYPNPFNPVTKIRFDIAKNGKLKSENGLVTLKVYDILGKEAATLVNERLKPGSYETAWDASGMSSGIYFYILNTGYFSETKRMIILK